MSKANVFARVHYLRPFVVYQGRRTAADRDFEGDIIPMCKMENMGLCPCRALGGGNFKTQAQRNSGEGRKMAAASEKQLKLSEVLERIGKKKGVPLTSELSNSFDQRRLFSSFATDKLLHGKTIPVSA